MTCASFADKQPSTLLFKAVAVSIRKSPPSLTVAMRSLSLIALVFIVGLSAKPLDPRTPEDVPEETPAKSFARSDANKDNALTFDEFLHSDLVFEQIKRDEFNNLDTNKDGLVRKEEFDSHYEAEKQNGDDLKAEYFGQLFEDFDEDFDLKLDIEEVKKVLETRFLLKTRDNFPEIFAKFDVNQDGGLDLSEYQKFDAEMPFHELDPVPSPVQVKKPILAFKTEKLPMMKPIVGKIF
ncbi:hypothetical protein QR680_001190 [Steinernema hermaphroditum]|uniref:EF-hand domain-containing protein n=1 Tax=Steinernema hermaphroditum TaxID=289476 RepID=A0AA39GZ88_9BILA|nr:hypothetical protein QR680_001190 [Steinernema hermaphroditum]